MRVLIQAAALLSVLATSAIADPAAPAKTGCYATWSAMPQVERARTTYQAYIAKCGGGIVSAAPVPAQSTGQCKDGTSYTQSKSRAAACSGHGGVDKWLQ